MWYSHTGRSILRALRHDLHNHRSNAGPLPPPEVLSERYNKTEIKSYISADTTRYFRRNILLIEIHYKCRWNHLRKRCGRHIESLHCLVFAYKTKVLYGSVSCLVTEIKSVHFITVRSHELHVRIFVVSLYNKV